MFEFTTILFSSNMRKATFNAKYQKLSKCHFYDEYSIRTCMQKSIFVGVQLDKIYLIYSWL